MRFGATAGVMAAAMALAQPVSAGVTPTSKVAATGMGCPGSLRANQHEVGGQRIVWTMALEDKDKKDQWPDPGGMGVHVAFGNARTRTRSLEISVSYLPLGRRLMPDSGADENNSQELKKTYVVTVDDKTQIQRDLMVGPAAAIIRVHLTSVTFADGSVWHPANDGACSIEPNRVLAVDGKESSLRW